MTLLEPLSYLRSPAQGFCDTSAALEYRGAAGCVRFDKATGRLTLDPPDLNVLQLHQAMQAVATQQDAAERARLLARLAQRPF
ncbi:hypothetical protein VSO52_23050 [Pseudomonas fulva]|uniref:hypothetical protein n=1 Tax=Pseudomonas fulva TaxID=47880 RepID=UPI002DB72078|nr:hypothetical protein [Pseudomonas fulva]MEC4025632.1 hypothetical protein [Pseudomonas fulva]